MFGYHHDGYGMMGFSWIVIILVLIALFYIFKGDKSSKKSARDILDERYAKGEIDLEEYTEKKKILAE